MTDGDLRGEEKVARMSTFTDLEPRDGLEQR